MIISNVAKIIGPFHGVACTSVATLGSFGAGKLLKAKSEEMQKELASAMRGDASVNLEAVAAKECFLYVALCGAQVSVRASEAVGYISIAEGALNLTQSLISPFSDRKTTLLINQAMESATSLNHLAMKSSLIFSAFSAGFSTLASFQKCTFEGVR